MTKLNISDLGAQQDILIIYISNDSEYSKTQIQNLESKRMELLAKNAGLYIIDNSKAVADGVFDKLKNKQQGVLVAKSNGDLIWSKLDLDFQDLGKAMIDFMYNYDLDTAGLDIFGWGNKIKEEGDYMCNDCGYILTVSSDSEFKIGMVFPTCDVCQSGEPEGPTGTLEPFWQKL